MIGVAAEAAGRPRPTNTRRTVSSHGPQNGLAEGAVKIVRRVASQLVHSGEHNIPIKMARRLWNYASMHACDLLMFWRTKHNGGISTAMKRYAEGKGARNPRWQARVLHIWGCRMVVRDTSGLKRDPRGRDVCFVGVLPAQTEEVLRALKFTPQHTVCSLVSTAPLALLREVCAPQAA